jgi:methylmalonyl-CoA/ethylmalonyl-CoA epimerase
MKRIAIGLVALAAANPVRAAELPEMYHKVASVHWVVTDLERVKQGWARLGFPALQDLGEQAIPGTFRAQAGASRFRIALARFDGVDVVWVQPVEGTSAFSEHLARHGDGVFSINYVAPSRAVLDAEVARLAGLGVGILQSADVVSAGGHLAIVHMDTALEGKYVLGLVSGDAPRPTAQAPPPPVPLKLSQYALVVNSLEPVSAYWQRLGFPAMEITHGPLSNLRYHGQPGRFDQKLGWHRHGTITWEWIEPLAGPTVYQDFLKQHGEGFHHLGFDVTDIDAASAAWEALGAPIVQSGAWGDAGKPGSGRFAYAATDAFGGVTTEFLWSHR